MDTELASITLSYVVAPTPANRRELCGVYWFWQGGLAPFGIFIWPHPLTKQAPKSYRLLQPQYLSFSVTRRTHMRLYPMLPNVVQELINVAPTGASEIGAACVH